MGSGFHHKEIAEMGKINPRGFQEILRDKDFSFEDGVKVMKYLDAMDAALQAEQRDLDRPATKKQLTDKKFKDVHDRVVSQEGNIVQAIQALRQKFPKL